MSIEIEEGKFYRTHSGLVAEWTDFDGVPASTAAIEANQDAFDELTRNLLIVFRDGTSTPYQNLVKGFALNEGEQTHEAVLRAARQVCGDHISLVTKVHNDNSPSVTSVADLQERCHAASYAAGWWHHPDSGLPYIPGDGALRPADRIAWLGLPEITRQMIIHYWPFVLATKMALIHSEVSEGLEALRRGAKDDKLAHRLGLETELADAVIREFDIAGAIARAQRLGVVERHCGMEGVGPFDLNGAIDEKMAFNKSRPDHKVAARRAAGGKAF